MSRSLRAARIASWSAIGTRRTAGGVARFNSSPKVTYRPIGFLTSIPSIDPLSLSMNASRALYPSSNWSPCSPGIRVRTYSAVLSRSLMAWTRMSRAGSPGLASAFLSSARAAGTASPSARAESRTSRENMGPPGFVDGGITRAVRAGCQERAVYPPGKRAAPFSSSSGASPPTGHVPQSTKSLEASTRRSFLTIGHQLFPKSSGPPRAFLVGPFFARRRTAAVFRAGLKWGELAGRPGCPSATSLLRNPCMSETVSRSLALDSRDEAILLFGNRDQFLRLVRDALGVRVVARGDTVQIDGPEEAVGQAERAFAQLRSVLRANGQLTSEDVKTVVEVVRAGSERLSPQTLTMMDGGKYLRPRTDGQGRYVQALRDNDVTVCVGPAGTGKTFLAVGMAVTLLRQGAVKKIVLVRPAVEAGERLGFLPGDLVAKINPYLRPLLDALNDLIEYEQVKKYMENDIIEIVPLAYMRGRTLSNAVIILDEGQNASIGQMKMFLTRMGMNSKIIVTGDITQIDLPPTVKSGLVDAVHRLRGIPRLAVIQLDESDIVRHALVQQIVKAYEEGGHKRR